MGKQFGDILKDLRFNRNLTQEELAKIIDTGKASISHYESNRRIPEINVLSKLADYFGVTVDYLLGKDKKVFFKENIDLLKGSMTYVELSNDIGIKLNEPRFSSVFDAAYLKDVAKGKIIPNETRLMTLSLYAQVPVDFFYRQNNSVEDIMLAREEYKNQIELNAKEKDLVLIKVGHLPNEIKEFITDPKNLKYLSFANKIKVQGIDPDDIVGFNLKLKN